MASALYLDECLSSEGEPFLHICQGTVQHRHEGLHRFASPPHAFFQHLHILLDCDGTEYIIVSY